MINGARIGWLAFLSEPALESGFLGHPQELAQSHNVSQGQFALATKQQQLHHHLEGSRGLWLVGEMKESLAWIGLIVPET
jgi:hypothetical protein